MPIIFLFPSNIQHISFLLSPLGKEPVQYDRKPMCPRDIDGFRVLGLLGQFVTKLASVQERILTIWQHIVGKSFYVSAIRGTTATKNAERAKSTELKIYKSSRNRAHANKCCSQKRCKIDGALYFEWKILIWSSKNKTFLEVKRKR